MADCELLTVTCLQGTAVCTLSAFREEIKTKSSAEEVKEKQVRGGGGGKQGGREKCQRRECEGGWGRGGV